MTRPITNRDMQRVTFVESLYNSLKKQTAIAISDHNKFLKIAKSYIDDGLEESECIELLMIDGLSRAAAESYASMVLSEEQQEVDGLHEYAFQFEDIYGKRWSSFDIAKTVRGASEEDAWEKADLLINEERGNERGIEAEKIISINRIS